MGMVIGPSPWALDMGTLGRYSAHHGRLWLTRYLDGRITVDVAEPRIMVSVHLLDSIRDGEFPNMSVNGGILRIDGDRTVIYLVKDQVPGLAAYYAEWPD